MDKKYATEEEIEVIEQRVKDLVQECVDFAEESDYPPVQQLYDVVYEQRTIHSSLINYNYGNKSNNASIERYYDGRNSSNLA
jgi:TPP-dependent pyruvate/acetoin dehydrogenase alpha subunit